PPVALALPPVALLSPWLISDSFSCSEPEPPLAEFCCQTWALLEALALPPVALALPPLPPVALPLEAEVSPPSASASLPQPNESAAAFPLKYWVLPVSALPPLP